MLCQNLVTCQNSACIHLYLKSFLRKCPYTSEQVARPWGLGHTVLNPRNQKSHLVPKDALFQKQFLIGISQMAYVCKQKQKPLTDHEEARNFIFLETPTPVTSQPWHRNINTYWTTLRIHCSELQHLPCEKWDIIKEYSVTALQLTCSFFYSRDRQTTTNTKFIRHCDSI
jgi:hypothetical protein